MKIAVGADHRGFRTKGEILNFLGSIGIDYHDFGTGSEDPVDYPDVARAVGEAVSRGEFDRGILICGTGIGVCMAANKIKSIRAAPCNTVFCARRSRQHNDANVLCLGADMDSEPFEEIIRAFLQTPFEGGRHQRRVEKISELESHRGRP